MRFLILFLIISATAFSQVQTQFTAILDGSLSYVRPFWGSEDLFNYSLIELQPEVDGLYDILNPSANLTVSNDPYIYLYENSFDPQNPEVNLLAFDDDGGEGLLFQLADIQFNSVTTYFMVATSYRPGSTGTFEIIVSGVGGVEYGGSVENPTIPESKNIAIILGIFALCYIWRRRLNSFFSL